MRRRAPEPEPVPQRFQRFSPDEWPGEPEEAIRAWGDARKAWARANPGTLGDSIDQARFVLAERRRYRAERFRAEGEAPADCGGSAGGDTEAADPLAGS